MISENIVKSQGGGGAVMRAWAVIRSNTVTYHSALNIPCNFPIVKLQLLNDLNRLQVLQGEYHIDTDYHNYVASQSIRLEFGSAAQLSKRPGSVLNCLWGNALKRSPGIIRKSRVSYPGPGFLSSATWPWLPKKHYNGLNQTKPNQSIRFWFESSVMMRCSRTR